MNKLFKYKHSIPKVPPYLLGKSPDSTKRLPRWQDMIA